MLRFCALANICQPQVYAVTRPMKSSQHIPENRIRDFALKNLLLDPSELLHFSDCDQCSDLWWRLKQEAKRQPKKDDTEKSA
jgi:hypothetical protein